MRVTLQEELDTLQASLLRGGRARPARRCAARSTRCARATPSSPTRSSPSTTRSTAQYLAIEQGIESLLARQTPVAVDLRFVLAVLHSNLHLERMADLCVTIAKLTKLAHGLPPDAMLVEGFDEMGSRAEEMIRVALDSFAERDVDGAESLVDLDELIDRTNRRVVSTCSSWRATRSSASGGCGCSSSRAASSGSATTPSTSASRRRTSSPASSASSPTPRTPNAPTP